MPLSETILLLCAFLALAMVAASLCRNLPIPFTVLLVVVGMGLRWLAGQSPALESAATLRLTPDLVFFVFLPALIFESALNLDARQLARDLAPVLMLAIPAMLLSTVVVGFGVHWLLGIATAGALLFGALISATDPVAVIALFKELGAPLRLTTLVEGESLFNDATAIVLFHILLGLAVAGGALGVGEIGAGAGEFLRVFIGGAVFGAVCGFGIAEFMRRLGGSAMTFLIMSLVMAYASFTLAEHWLHVSGVMATLSAALAMSAYGVTRISQAALTSIRETWEIIALVCNSLLFLMMGVSVDLPGLVHRLPAIVGVALLVTLARALAVYPLVPATTRLFRLPRVSLGERHIMCWGGLKGGLAIAIALSLPEDLPVRQSLIELTLGVVLFTLLVNAPTIRPLIRRLGIDRLTDGERSELGRGLGVARVTARHMLDRLQAATVVTGEVADDIARQVDASFAREADEAVDGRALARAQLQALRVEMDALDQVFDIGLIDEYIYLDLRSTLRLDRIRHASGEAEQRGRLSLFVRMETTVLRWLRERNWAAGLLARYQRLRLSQRLQRDIAGILTAQAVLDALASEQEIDVRLRESVAGQYRERLARRQARVAAIRREFPDFYAAFERRFVLCGALNSARREVEGEYHHGALPAKAYGRIAAAIDDALHSLPDLPLKVGTLSLHDLIRRVPLFNGLPLETIRMLAGRARPVDFLPGDIVIGQDEHGSALYVIVHGTVFVSRRDENGGEQRLATLASGDYFGETALLGDEVRTATVRAAEPVALLRLTREDVLAVAAQDPDFDQHLHATAAARNAEQSSPHPS